jgi:hypothetical protein
MANSSLTCGFLATNLFITTDNEKIFPASSATQAARVACEYSATAPMMLDRLCISQNLRKSQVPFEENPRTNNAAFHQELQSVKMFQIQLGLYYYSK